MINMRMDIYVAKSAKNLYLDPEIIERGEEYGRLHGITLSRLVSDFLRALPLERDPTELAPVVRRLIGAGIPQGVARDAVDVEDYRQHLLEKFGRR
jgi:hypothetical protein